MTDYDHQAESAPEANAAAAPPSPQTTGIPASEPQPHYNSPPPYPQQGMSPPPRNDGFFASSPPTPPQKRSGSSGCFWAMIIIILVMVAGIVIGGVVLIAGGISSLKSTMGQMGDGGLAPGKYQETVVSGNRSSDNKIAVVYVNGVISGTDDGGFSSRGATAAVVNRKLRHILKDHRIKAVVVRIDSPGGEVTASDEIHHMLLRIRKERKIPVVASMGSMAASGGYYIAVGCDYIVAHRMTTTGSIGVIIQTYKYYDLFQKIGIKGEAYTSGPMKDMLAGDRPTTPAEQEVVKQILAHIYTDFVKVVAAGRSKYLTAEKIRDTKIGDGRIFLGSEALKLHLVDELGYFEDAVNKAAALAHLGENYKVVTLNEPFSLATLFGQMETSEERAVKLEMPGSKGVKLEKGKFYLLPKDMIEQP
ncbi:MAG: signal peptide peptidase SppA [Victivallales bacterium]|nr:signal peptide peptidase SppA [Victivallales bacterium]